MRAISFVVAVIVADLTVVAPVSSQEPQRTDSLENEIRLLRARLDSLQALLERLVREGADPEPVQDELAALRAAAQEAAGQQRARVDTTGQAQSRTRNLQVLNPEISVTGDFVGTFIAPAGADNNASATPREFEFSFQSALDPYAHTKIFITREEDFEIAGFPEEEGEEEGHGFEIEEGYVYWVGLPGGFGAKLGKFRQEIGLYNRWHTHALLDVERPLAATTFLGEDGLIQTGAAITFPSLTLGPATQTLTFEVTRASNDALFAGGSELGFLGRLQSFVDLGASSYLQFGSTGAYGENDEQSLTSKLLALDVSFRWTPPGRALYQDLQVKGEWYVVEQELAGTERSGNGGYVQANYRLNRRWILGARADVLNGFDDEPQIFQFAPSITWWQSEWVRLRLQYNYLKPEGSGGNHTILLQTVWAVGPHKHATY